MSLLAIDKDGRQSEPLIEYKLELKLEDTRTTTNGPGGKDCFNKNERVDATPFDNAFTCKCTAPHTGSNCGVVECKGGKVVGRANYTNSLCPEESPEESSAAASEGARGGDDVAVIIGAAFAFTVLATVVVLLIMRRQARAMMNRPADFQEEFDRLLKEGRIVVAPKDNGEDLGPGEPAEDTSLPREIPRKCVSLTDKLGNGAFGEVRRPVHCCCCVGATARSCAGSVVRVLTLLHPHLHGLSAR